MFCCLERFCARGRLRVCLFARTLCTALSVGTSAARRQVASAMPTATATEVASARASAFPTVRRSAERGASGRFVYATQACACEYTYARIPSARAPIRTTKHPHIRTPASASAHARTCANGWRRWRHSKDGRSTRGSCPFHDDRTCCQHHRTQRVLCVYRPIPLWQQRWRARDVCGRHQRRCGRAEHCSQAITTAVPSEPIAFLPPGKCGTVPLT